MLGSGILQEIGLVKIVESHKYKDFKIELNCTNPFYILSCVRGKEIKGFWISTYRYETLKEKDKEGKKEWCYGPESNVLGSKEEIVVFITSLKDFPEDVKSEFLKSIENKNVDFTDPKKYCNN